MGAEAADEMGAETETAVGPEGVGPGRAELRRPQRQPRKALDNNDTSLDAIADE